MQQFPRMVTRIKSFKITFADDNSVKTEMEINASCIGSEKFIF